MEMTVLKRVSLSALASALLFTSSASHGASKTQSATAPAPTCTVSGSEFKSWESSSSGGSPSFVPPNSAGFTVTQGDCSFYKWSAQMFLWLTSKSSSGTLTMFSPTFYNAVENPNTGDFTFVQNTESNDKSKPPKLHLMTRVNKTMLVGLQAKLAKLGKLSSLKGVQAENANSTGQAGGGVLMVNGNPVPVPGQSGLATYPVVYYAIQVNDVFVGLAQNQTSIPYYTSGSSAGDFPISLPQAQQIQTAAKASYSDLNQLALELKSAWIDTAYLTPAQSSGLLQITADVPAFTQTTNSSGFAVLTWDGKTTVSRTLAMVGMHVAGSVAGHPEMVWSTFESVFNSPDATYSYLNTNYDPKKKACKSGTTCITTVSFSTSNSTPTILYNGPAGATVPPSAITQTATSSGNNTTITSTFPPVSATQPFTPTSVIRLNPWGNQQPSTPTVTNAVVVNNTLLISLNQSLQSQLSTAGDTLLTNYFEGGALWSNGIIPFLTGSEQIGSLYLANTTMETFQQLTPGSLTQPNSPAQNCFTCHGDYSGGTEAGTVISHVFPQPSN
jgi:hypothetical protein